MSIRGLSNHSGPSCDLTSVLFNKDGSARVFVEAPASEAAPRSSYPEPRHLVGISPENAVQDTHALAPAVVAWSRDLALAGGRSEDQLRRERVEWHTASLLRQAIAYADPRLECECGSEGKVLQHNASDRQKLSPYRCQQRATCPACGMAYGQQRGLELAALLDAVLQPGRLVVEVPKVAAWHLVLSCDRRVSAYVAQLVDAGRVEQLRKVMRHLTEDVQATLRAVYGGGVAGVVAWHWWHSSDPLSSDMHLHAHVTVPNVSVSLDADTGVWTPDLRPLSRKGVLSAERLEDLRYQFGRAVCSHRWAARLVRAPLSGGPQSSDRWQPNAHVRFTQGPDGQGYRHRLRYDARTSVSDVLALCLPDEVKASRLEHEALLGEEHLDVAFDQLVSDVAEVACHPGLELWVHRASIWQKVQTVRYTGWLVNAARKSLGLLRDESDSEAEWASVGLYRLLDAESVVVNVERWSSTGRRVEQWHQSHVQLLPGPAAVTSWCWSDAVRPLRRAGPPAAWLARAGINKGD